MAWKLSPALVRLRDEINAAYPTRSKASDGSIGDTAHSARKSDHNPDSAGWVRAIDVTEWDPGTPNVDGDDVAEALAEFLRASKDPRVKYVIWRGRMFASYATASRKAWTWGRYTGPNGHFKHCHVSVVADARGLDPKAWGFSIDASPGGFPHRVIRKGDKGPDVIAIKYGLNLLRKHTGRGQLPVTDVYDDLTASVVGSFQKFARSMQVLAGVTDEAELIDVDQVWGPQTGNAANFWGAA